MRFTITIFLLLAAFGSALHAQQNYYTVKFPDDKTIIGCGAAPSGDAPVITYQNYNCGFNVGVSYNDQVFYLNNTKGCAKVVRTWKLIWWCDYDPNYYQPTIIINPDNTDTGPTVQANAQNHGYLQYVQIIKIRDVDAPQILNCPASPVTFCDYTGNDPAQYNSNYIDRCEGPVDLQINSTDACSGSDLIVTYRLFLDLDGNGSMETLLSSNAPTAWPIEHSINGAVRTSKVKFPTGIGLPYGKHAIEWIVNDKCGNSKTCKYEFTVKDCKAPTLTCRNGLSVNIMQTGMITINLTDLLLYKFDNCTPVSQIKTGIRIKGTDVGFPENSPSVTFTCQELGKIEVEIWGQDAYGNADYCLTYVDVQDHVGACPPPGPAGGNLKTAYGMPLSGAKLQLQSIVPGDNLALEAATDAEGNFQFGANTPFCNYKLTPGYSSLPTEGFNIADILLTSRHLAGLDTLKSPFQLLAADADGNKSIAATDLSVMNDVLLGTQTQFGSNWQFVPSTHPFPQLANPWLLPLPGTIQYACANSITNLPRSFTAIKTGDVNQSALASLQNKNTEDRAVETQWHFGLRRERFSAGDEIQVPVYLPLESDLAAFQLALEYSTNDLQLMQTIPGVVAAKSLFADAQGQVRALWYSPDATAPVAEGAARPIAFTLVFKALQSGTVQNSIQLGFDFSSEGVQPNLKTAMLGLEFFSQNANTGIALLPVQPNPAKEVINVSFEVAESGPVQISLHDISGHLLQTQQFDAEAGLNSLQMPVPALPSGSLLLLNAQSAQGRDVQKVMIK